MYFPSIELEIEISLSIFDEFVFGLRCEIELR